MLFMNWYTYLIGELVFALGVSCIRNETIEINSILYLFQLIKKLIFTISSILDAFHTPYAFIAFTQFLSILFIYT